MDCLFRPTRDGRGLLITVAITIVVVVGLNGLIFALGWSGAPRDAAMSQRPLLPPGWVIGGVWTALFALFAAAHWWLASAGDQAHRQAARWVLAFMAFCLAYPFYTAGFAAEQVGFAANLLTIALNGLLVGRLWPVSRGAALLMTPSLPWVCFATYAVAAI